MRSANALAAWLCLLAACSSPPPPPAPHAPRPVVEIAKWEVHSDGRLVGYVRRFEIRDPSGPLPFYRIYDTDGHWVGHADAIGRFSKRVPFQDDEQDLGVWSMARGVAELLDAGAPVRLQPVALHADAKKSQR